MKLLLEEKDWNLDDLEYWKRWDDGFEGPEFQYRFSGIDGVTLVLSLEGGLLLKSTVGSSMYRSSTFNKLAYPECKDILDKMVETFKLKEDPSEYVKALLKGKYSPEARHVIGKIAEKYHGCNVEEVNKEIDKQKTTKLSQSTFMYDRERAARSTSTPEDVLIALSKDPSIEVRMAAANNRKLSAQALKEMFEHTTSVDLKKAIANNSSIDKEFLTELINDKNKEIAKAAMTNRGVTVKIRGELIKNKYARVRFLNAWAEGWSSHLRTSISLSIAKQYPDIDTLYGCYRQNSYSDELKKGVIAIAEKNKIKSELNRLLKMRESR